MVSVAYRSESPAMDRQLTEIVNACEELAIDRLVCSYVSSSQETKELIHWLRSGVLAERTQKGQAPRMRDFNRSCRVDK